MRSSFKNITCIILFSTLFFYGCQDNPVLKIFQRDLQLNILLKNHGDLHQGAPVMVVGSFNQEKKKIGIVSKVAETDSGVFNISISIDHRFKKDITNNNDFILINNIFSDIESQILVVESAAHYTPEALKSGTVIKGKNYLEYTLSMSFQGMNGWLKDMISESQQFLEELEQKINSLDVNSLLSQLEDYVTTLKKYSDQQRAVFERDVLPALERLINQALKLFENHVNEKTLQEIREKYDQIEKIIRA